MTEIATHEQQPMIPYIDEPEVAMTYLGVRVEKAKKTTDRVPDKSLFERRAHTATALRMDRDLAIGIKTNTSVFFEGGSGLGKSTEVKAVAAELNYEFYEITCTPQTDRETLFGTWERKSPEDPEQIFVPGPLTRFLQPSEEGVKKMLLMNEPNAPYDGLKILNEVFDALDSNGAIEIRSADGSRREKVQVNREALFIVLTANTPSAREGYTHVLPTSKDFATRVNKITLPEELPDADFRHSWRAKLRKAPKFQEVLPGEFIYSNERALTDDELLELDGAADVLELYPDFHEQLLQLMEDDIIQKSPHGQALGFGSYKQQERIWSFMKNFSREGSANILQTLKTGLRYYYASRMYGKDREHIEEMIHNLGKDMSKEETLTDHIDNELNYSGEKKAA